VQLQVVTGVFCWQVIDKRLIDGADEYLQVMDLCTIIMQQICNAS